MKSVAATIRAVAGPMALRMLYGSLPPEDGTYVRSVSWGESGGEIVRSTLVAGGPCLVGRFGSSELSCISYYVRWRAGRRTPLPYPSPLRRVMRVNAGVFPVDDESLDRFSETFLAAVSETDVMGVWFNRNEHEIVLRFCPNARLVQLEALNPVLWPSPWSTELEGKVVLVVHPFARTIESQYREHREELFENPRVLPEFELKTLVAVQSIAGSDCGYPSWSRALDHMRDEVAATDFDVAVIGAGAYGLPLAAEVKRLGRQAVHLGGATQLLFGIKGRRWEVESPDDIAPLFNEHWVRPSAEETPTDSGMVEGGCYW